MWTRRASFWSWWPPSKLLWLRPDVPWRQKPVTVAQPLPADASWQEGLKCLLDAWSFPDVLTATGWSRDGHPWSLPVCGGVRVCPRTLVLLPSPSLISLHLSSSPNRPWSSLLPCGVWGGPSPGFLFQGEEERRIRMSESQISAVMATVHSSINGDEVNKKKKRICLQCRRRRFDPRVRKIPWRREWLPTPVFLPGEFHGRRSLASHSPWGSQRIRPNWATFIHSLTHSPRFVCCCLLAYSFSDLDGLFWYFPPLCEASDMLLRGCSPGYMHNNSRMAVVAELSENCFPELSVKLAASAGIIPNF